MPVRGACFFVNPCWFACRDSDCVCVVCVVRVGRCGEGGVGAHKRVRADDAVHERVKKLSNELAFRPDEEEEFEDDEGNVFNKKTYLDLRRQGLV